MDTRETVIVAFRVNRGEGFLDNDKTAAQIVEDRLSALRVLWDNDSNDFQRGVADPINSYVVIDVETALEESL